MAYATFLRFGKCGFSVEKAVKIGRNLQKKKPGAVENQGLRAGRIGSENALRGSGVTDVGAGNADDYSAEESVT